MSDLAPAEATAHSGPLLNSDKRGRQSTAEHLQNTYGDTNGSLSDRAQGAIEVDNKGALLHAPPRPAVFRQDCGGGGCCHPRRPMPGPEVEGFT